MQINRGVALMLLVMDAAVVSRASGQPVAEVTDVSTMVSVVVRVRAGEGKLFVPVCGADEGRLPLLCSASTHLEVQDKNGWRAAGRDQPAASWAWDLSRERVRRLCALRP